VFVSSIDELYLLVTVEASSIFRSQFGSSVGGDFCDAVSWNTDFEPGFQFESSVGDNLSTKYKKIFV
jgi:hypothetical protein